MTSTLWQAGAVALGGSCGCVLRFGLNEWLVRRAWMGIPLATFAANALGCLLAGVVLAWMDARGGQSPFWRNLLMVGFLGGLTTFSAWSVELWQFLRVGRYDLLALSVLVSVAVGVAAVAAGWKLGRLLLA